MAAGGSWRPALVAALLLLALLRYRTAHPADTEPERLPDARAASIVRRVVARVGHLREVGEKTALKVTRYAKGSVRLGKGEDELARDVLKYATSHEDAAPPPHPSAKHRSASMLYPEDARRHDLDVATSVRDHLQQHGVHVDRKGLLKLIQPSKREYRDFARYSTDRPSRPPPPAPPNYVLVPPPEDVVLERGPRHHVHGARAREQLKAERLARAEALQHVEEHDGPALTETLRSADFDETLKKGFVKTLFDETLQKVSSKIDEQEETAFKAEMLGKAFGAKARWMRARKPPPPPPPFSFNDSTPMYGGAMDDAIADATHVAPMDASELIEAPPPARFQGKDGDGFGAAFADAIDTTHEELISAPHERRREAKPYDPAYAQPHDATSFCMGAPHVWDPLTTFESLPPPPEPEEHDLLWEVLHPVRLRPPPPPPPEFRTQIPGAKITATQFLGKRYSRLHDVQEAIGKAHAKTHLEVSYKNLKNGQGAADLLHDVKWIERHGQPKVIAERAPSVRVARRRQLLRLHRRAPSCASDASPRDRQMCAAQRALERCKTEDELGAKLRDNEPLTEAELTLAECIRNIDSCMASKHELRRTARKLKSLRYFIGGDRPKCFVQNWGGEPELQCDPIKDNQETALYMDDCESQDTMPGCNSSIATKDSAGEAARAAALPATDEFRTRRYGRCAVVGNAPHLFRSASGAAIDRHDAVVRFSPLKEVANAPEPKVKKHLGTRTTLRLLNRRYTTDILKGTVKKGALDVTDAGGANIFWHLYAANYLQHMQAKHPSSPLRLIATDLANWELAAFFALRVDLIRLGLGPFSCYRSMSSGMHGLLLSFLMCERVGVFGFSVAKGPRSRAAPSHPSDLHAFPFEEAALRLFYLAGLADVCSA